MSNPVKTGVDLDALLARMREFYRVFRTPNMDEAADAIEQLRRERDEARKIAGMDRVCLIVKDGVTGPMQYRHPDGSAEPLIDIVDQRRALAARVTVLEGTLSGLIAVVGLTAFKHETQREALQEMVDIAQAALKESRA